jgi:protein SCO1/2
MMRTKAVWAAVAFVAAVLAAPEAGAQVSAHTGNEGHAPKAAPVAPTRVMDIQPVLDGIDLIDQDGRPVALADVLGTDEPVMVNFIFTTCTTICPVMSAGFSQLQSSLGDERDRVRLVSISIDPEADTPATLRAYALRYHAGKSWVFLTGTIEASEAAQRAFGADRGDKTGHAPTTYVRRSRHGAWEQLDGLSSGERLLAAYRGTGPSPRRH